MKNVSASQKQNRNRRIVREILPAVLLFLWIFLINRKVHISWMFIDDLYLWDSFSRESFRSFVFPTEAAYFRPVFWLLSWLELKAVGTQISLIVPIHLTLLFLLSLYLYRFLKQLSGSLLTALFLTLMFSASRFSYYQNGQILGLMETAAMAFTFFMCRLLYGFLHGEKPFGYYAAGLCWLLASLSHERFMVLIPMLFYAAAVRYRREKGKGAAGEGKTLAVRCFYAAFLFLLLQLMRRQVIGTLLPQGTGGTMVTEAFSKKGFLRNAVCEILYLFGINAGPVHLNGVPWQETPLLQKILTVLFLAMIVRIVILFFRKLSRRREECLPVWEELLYFAGYIIGLTTASSVTIRVEMRWLYTSFAVCTMILAFMTGYLHDPVRVSRREGGKKVVSSVMLLTVCLSCLMIGNDLWYRSHSRNLYVIEEQHRKESFLEKTAGVYGEDILKKKIYVLGNFYQVTPFEEQNFHRPWNWFPEPLAIFHVNGVEELPAGEEENLIVLYEDPEKDTYEYAAWKEALKEAAK